jgi:hypothetical protein
VAMVLALRATTECAAAMAAIVDVVTAPEPEVVDGPAGRHVTEIVTLAGRRELTPAVNGGSAVGAEAVHAEFRLGPGGQR